MAGRSIVSGETFAETCLYLLDHHRPIPWMKSSLIVKNTVTRCPIRKPEMAPTAATGSAPWLPVMGVFSLDRVVRPVT
jgi:hypothetical protein